MTKISDTQSRILKAASKQPKTDVREFMKDLKSPAIRDKVVTSMLNNGLVAEDPDAEGVSYIISEAGFAAIGKKPSAAPVKVEKKKAAAAEKAPAKKAAKENPERTSKKQTMTDMLTRKEGTTIAQLMKALDWQKHSVHGAMANLKKEIHEKNGQTITATVEGDERFYKIA